MALIFLNFLMSKDPTNRLWWTSIFLKEAGRSGNFFRLLLLIVMFLSWVKLDKSSGSSYKELWLMFKKPNDVSYVISFGTVLMSFQLKSKNSRVLRVLICGDIFVSLFWLNTAIWSEGNLSVINSSFDTLFSEILIFLTLGQGVMLANYLSDICIFSSKTTFLSSL